ncbi:MAG: hypothetical protein K2V38_16035 [Gemmataceae bacterium]|nr:hypothetical protein [Gemmataceae bacterium]
MSALASLLSTLNDGANWLGRVLAPVEGVPGVLSLTVVSVLTGAAMLLAFKHTSNQKAIKRARQQIRANLLAVKLFKDNVRVGLRAQARVFAGALKLLLNAVVPMLVMAVPMALFLAQLAAWYEFAPVPVGGETVVTLKLSGELGDPLPNVALAPDPAFEVITGPVQLVADREVCWHIRARQPGYHTLRFALGEPGDGPGVTKELTVGAGVMRVAPKRPARGALKDQLEYPREAAFVPVSVVKQIEIEYPPRSGRLSGSGNWLIYWFLASCVAGFCLRGVLKVNI